MSKLGEKLIAAARHNDCVPATCSNGKCNATGECVEANKPTSTTNVFARMADDGGIPHMPNVKESIALRTAAEIETERKKKAPPVSSPRTIVAFTGLAGAGKSTAAAHLVKRHGYERVRFAGPLKAMMAALGCTPEQIDGSEKETPCDLLGGKTPRWAMQTLGTEWGRQLITQDLWTRAWRAAVDRVPAGVPVVVDDLRFPNEADAVRAVGGVIVGVMRPGAGTTSVHASEQQTIEVAETLRNIADEQYLRDLVDILVTDLSWRDQSLAA